MVSSLSEYVKGKAGNKLDNKDQGDKEEEMFSTSYWFGEKSVGQVQEDPWLPSLVSVVLFF